MKRVQGTYVEEPGCDAVPGAKTFEGVLFVTLNNRISVIVPRKKNEKNTQTSYRSFFVSLLFVFFSFQEMDFQLYNFSLSTDNESHSSHIAN